MTKNRTIKFIIGEEQLQSLKQRAIKKGYITLSAYLRECVFSENHLPKLILIKLNQIENEIKKANRYQQGKDSRMD